MMGFFKSKSGGSKVEHALLAALIGIFCIVALNSLGASLGDLFARSGTSLPPPGKSTSTR